MGSYGIGVERAMASVVEGHHDEFGIVWPVAVAPFQVAIVLIGRADDAAAKRAEELYDQLTQAGVDVILDDRDERPGVKFRDVELVGIPYYATVGGRSLADGNIEVTTRAGREKATVPVDDAAEHLRRLVTKTEA
jgi:prolyl-tRNA synthetase